MFDSQMTEFRKQANAFRRTCFLQNAIYWIEKTVIEALIAIVVAWVLSLIIGMLPTLLEQILPPLIYNEESWKKIVGALTIKRLWAILFGIRFVINYLVHGFDGLVKTNKE